MVAEHGRDPAGHVVGVHPLRRGRGGGRVGDYVDDRAEAVLVQRSTRDGGELVVRLAKTRGHHGQRGMAVRQARERLFLELDTASRVGRVGGIPGPALVDGVEFGQVAITVRAVGGQRVQRHVGEFDGSVQVGDVTVVFEALPMGGTHRLDGDAPGRIVGRDGGQRLLAHLDGARPVCGRLGVICPVPVGEAEVRQRRDAHRMAVGQQRERFLVHVDGLLEIRQQAGVLVEPL